MPQLASVIQNDSDILIKKHCMYNYHDPSKKVKPKSSSKDKGKKAFKEGLQDNNTQETPSYPITNASRKIVNTQEEDIIVNKQDKKD